MDLASDLNAMVAAVRAHERAAKLAKKKVEVAYTSPAITAAQSPPDALVLCTMEIECLTCHRVHRSPSHHMLLRRGRNYSHTLQSTVFFAHVPREHITKKETAPMCHECFGTDPTTHFD